MGWIGTSLKNLFLKRNSKKDTVVENPSDGKPHRRINPPLLRKTLLLRIKKVVVARERPRRIRIMTLMSPFTSFAYRYKSERVKESTIWKHSQIPISIKRLFQVALTCLRVRYVTHGGLLTTIMV